MWATAIAGRFSEAVGHERVDEIIKGNGIMCHEIVHTHRSVSKSLADQIVKGVLSIV